MSLSSKILKDLSFSAFSAGLVAVLVGFASSVAIVFQAAQASGATQAMTVSWIGALGIGMGVTCIGYSLYYKAPIIIAWSTPGAALLAVSINNLPIEQVIGAFVFCGLLTVVLGLSGMFDRVMSKLPLPIASAMLAGILLPFGLDIFLSFDSNPVLVALMLVTYLVARKFIPRYSILLVLLTGVITAFGFQAIPLEITDTNQMVLSLPVLVVPEFDWQVLLGIGVPLFIVTMSAQNVPGVAILRTSGYAKVPVSPIITGTGVTTMMLAPFGGFTFNLAAITAAICTSEESHHDPDKRYIAGISTGIFNIIAGVGGATVVTLFATFPKELIATLAGLALLGTIGNSLATATAEIKYRESAMVTFLVTASSVTILGIASPFWGLIAGVITQLVIEQRQS